MAVTAIVLDQTNISGTCDLLAIHSPVILLASATYTGIVPHSIYARLYNSSDELLGTYRLIPRRDTLETERQFMFRIDEIIRGFLPIPDETYQADNTLAFMDNMASQFYFKFSETATSRALTYAYFRAVNAAAQFGETVAKTGLFNNDAQSVVGATGGYAYAYFYNSDVAGTITVEETSQNIITEDFITISEVYVSNLTKTQISASVIRLKISFASVDPIAGTATIPITAPLDISKYRIKIVGFSGNFGDPLDGLSRFLFGVKYGASSQWLTEIIPAVGEFEHVIDLAGVTDFYINMTKQGTVDDIYVDIDFIQAYEDTALINPCV